VMGRCTKCNILIYASYEKIGKRKVWDVHFETQAPGKRKPRKEFWFWVAVLIFVGILARVIWEGFGAQ
jgi:hypothetical protein